MSVETTMPSAGPGVARDLERLERFFRARRPGPTPGPQRGHNPAAVLVLFLSLGDEPGLLFTERSMTVEYHKGQISFVGGVAESSDADLEETARREAVEELGVRPEDIGVWGPMSVVNTTSGFSVLPFAGFLADRDNLSPSAEEVAAVLEVPLRALLEPENARDIAALESGQMVQEPAYAYGGRIIWGATATILTEVLDLIRESESLEPR